MAYSTVANIRTETGFKNSTNITDAYVTQKIAEADSIIDSKIVDVYSLPLASTPDIIVFISKEIASGLLYLDQYGEEIEDSALDGQKKIDYAMKVLDDIQSRKMKLLDSNGDELSVSNLLQPAFYPTQTSTDSGDTKSFFTVKQQF